MMSERFTDDGGNQTPDVLEWRRSLRSPSPGADQRSSRNMEAGTRSLRSRTPSPLRSKTVRSRKLRSRSPSPNINSKGISESDQSTSLFCFLRIIYFYLIMKGCFSKIQVMAEYIDFTVDYGLQLNFFFHLRNEEEVNLREKVSW